MMSDFTREVFNQTAATYDAGRARLIPGFVAFYGAALALLPKDATRILDLGAGTGLFSAMVLDHLPGASLHLVDQSEAMLAQARERFPNNPQVDFECADYTVAALGAGYDAVVSALSIHHLSDAAKQSLFVRIRDTLKPGGAFVNAEQILAETSTLEREAKSTWLAEVRDLGATDEQIAASLLRQTEDRCATVVDQLNWMQRAGFVEVSCPFQQGRFAVLYARSA